MESQLNKLLARQIKKHFGSVENLPQELKGIISDINNTYTYFEDDVLLLQNSIEISSQELRSAFQKHKQDAEAQKETISKINEAILAIRPSTDKGSTTKETISSDSRHMFNSLISLIEERKHTEAEILKLSLAVEQNPASIVITDVHGNIEYVNPKFCDLTGYTKEEVIGGNPRILKSVDSSPELYKELWDTIISGKEWKGEFHNRKKNGDLYWEIASISAVKNPNGDIVNFLAIKEDITERKQVTEALGESEKKYREVVQNVKEVIFQTDASGLWIFLNQAWEEITGFSVEESMGQLFVNYVHPDDRQRNMELFEPLIQRKKDYCRHQIRYLTKDGGFRWIEVFARLGLNEKDEITGTFGTLQDITERKMAEESLQNERTLFRTIIDLIPDAVYVKDIHGRKIIANPKEVEIAGMGSEDQIIGKTDSDLYPSEVARHSDAEDQFVLQSEKPMLNYEGSIIDNEGRIHSLLGSKVPLFDAAGKITGIVGVSHDITERKKAEDALQAAHKSLSDILNAAIHTSIIATDVNGIITVFSKGAEKMLGYTTQDVVGKITPELFHLESEVEERGHELSNELGQSIKGFDIFVAKAKIQEHEERIWTYRCKDGKVISVNLVVTAIKNNNAEVIGFLGIASDITDRKRAEEEVKRVSTRLALATLAGGVGVWDFDIENNILLWDDQMFALYGTKREDFNSAYETWLAGVHPDDKKRADEEIQMAIRGEKEFDTEFRVCWPDGSVHNIRALANVQCDVSGKKHRMIGTNWDITEQKKNEAVLLKARQDAEMANKAKSVFLANMSHEIRTPLNAIIGFSQLMNRDKHLTDAQREYNIAIIRAGEHLLSLINDILELSKMEAGRLELNPVNIDLGALLSEIQIFFKEQIQSKHLQFIFETAPDLPRVVLVDDNKLRRIFINLIGNAIKFTDEGGIAVRVRTEQLNSLKSRLIVEVQDSGPGIPENEIGKLFKHFVQTSSGVSKSSGTGLGLALSRELAILMGGDIRVISEVGKGSVFTFYVEIEVGKDKVVQETMKQRVLSIDNGKNEYRILVVDDTEENRQVVVRLLNLVGFITMEAVNGEDAIAKFDEWNPHLILMDMRMPVMDGYEATRRIKQTEKGIQTPIVALTASSFEDEQKKIGELGIHGYIRKPFRESELFGTIGNVLDIKYIFEDESACSAEKSELTKPEIIQLIATLSDDLAEQMRNAVAAADLDLLIELIHRIDVENSDLARHLISFANNYDYEYLQKILNKEEIGS
jgi:PAS domain S-box-containing protein